MLCAAALPRLSCAAGVASTIRPTFTPPPHRRLHSLPPVPSLPCLFHLLQSDRHLTLQQSLTLELRPFRLRILLQRILELPSPPCSSRRVRRRDSWVLGACRVSWRANGVARERV